MDEIKKTYTNGEITITWDPDLCNHSAICFRSLPNVFKPDSRPWIDMKGASTDEIARIVRLCPTRALTYSRNSEIIKEKTNKDKTKISILQDGPYLIEGNFEIFDENGNKIICEDGAAFCRCGDSYRKPFCDGSHNNSNFKG